jgi:uncharacterized membrane protein YkvA (DUF1232 family)
LKKRAHALKAETYALYLAVRDPRTPWYAKVLAGAVVAHTFSPIDLIPDFIPVLGYLDDLLITPIGIWLALRMIPPEVMAESREKANAALLEAKPTNWGAAVVIVVIWLILTALIVIFLIGLVRK